jgi:hypothetical protein
MDPNNPVVQLCVRGMQAEADGRPGIAAETFRAAWESAGDDFERCIAAHYVARHQSTPEAVLEWNARCLALAEAVGDARVAGFYPSLYLNLGKAAEDLGRPAEARGFYAAAENLFVTLPDDDYGAMVRGAVVRGLLRVGSHTLDDPADQAPMDQ